MDHSVVISWMLRPARSATWGPHKTLSHFDTQSGHVGVGLAHVPVRAGGNDSGKLSLVEVGGQGHKAFLALLINTRGMHLFTITNGGRGFSGPVPILDARSEPQR